MSHPKKYKILIVSPGIEDGGIRGLGRVTLALIDGLAAASQETYLLTSAPLQRPTRKPGSRIHNATIRRALDHYLAEGIRSPMFKLRRWLLLQIFMRDFFRLFGLGHVDALGHKHQIPTQHQPDVLRQYERLSGFFNFGFFYKFSQILPRRLTSAIVFSIARRQGIDAIITASPYPLFNSRNCQYISTLSQLGLGQNVYVITFGRNVRTETRQINYPRINLWQECLQLVLGV